MRFEPSQWPGDDQVGDLPWGDLKPFVAHYEFRGHLHCITIWESCWADAHRHAHEHGMRVLGPVTKVIKAK